MKKTITTLFALLILVLSSYAQSWDYYTGGNKFEGFKYEVAAGMGEGKFPYNEPLFLIRNSDKFGLEFMLSGINYCGDDDILKMYVDDGEVLKYYFSTSTDGQTLFLNMTKEQEKQIVSLLKNGSKLYVRIYTNSNIWDYKFSLTGSTVSINKLSL